MSTPMDIQWHILRAIPQYPRSTTSGDIQQSLERAGLVLDQRSVQRHLQTLSAIFPITVDETTRPYRWSWMEGAPALTVPGIDAPTALAFVAAEAFLQPLLPKSTLAYLAPHFQMAREALDRMPETFGSWRNKVRSVPRGFRLQAPLINDGVEEAVYEGLLNNRALNLSYQGRNDAEPREFSVVHPQAIVYRDPVIYLVCTMWDYDDLRQLVLHRIGSAEVLDVPAKALPDFDVDEYIAHGELGFRVGEPVRLVAKFDGSAALHLAETPVSDDQKLTTLPDGRMLLEASVPHTEELVWWLRGFGDAVEVVSPKLD